MKKIAVIAPYPFLPAGSGGQKLIDSFTRFLGAASSLLVIGTDNNLIPESKPYTFLPLLNKHKWRYTNPFLIKKLTRPLKKNQTEILILEHPYFGWIIPFLRTIKGIKIICHTHNVESLRFRSLGKFWWRLLYIYEKWVLKNCDQVWCITEEDQSFFTGTMKIPVERCSILPYGIDLQHAPADKTEARETVCRHHDLDTNLPLLFFNGVLDYKPNQEALNIILDEILPRLKKKNFPFYLIVAGKNLPQTYQELRNYRDSGVVYAGFVNNIDLYTKAADLLLNPVISGGGIKTKMIEALAMNTGVVSTKSGAAGVDPVYCGEKLKLAADRDWDTFTNLILETVQDKNSSTPNAFYDHFNWGKIIQRMLQQLPQ
jgi:glycosyltransferase involved in cell wall biosynthesis